MYEQLKPEARRRLREFHRDSDKMMQKFPAKFEDKFSTKEPDDIADTAGPSEGEQIWPNLTIQVVEMDESKLQDEIKLDENSQKRLEVNLKSTSEIEASRWFFKRNFSDFCFFLKESAVSLNSDLCLNDNGVSDNGDYLQPTEASTSVLGKRHETTGHEVLKKKPRVVSAVSPKSRCPIAQRCISSKILKSKSFGGACQQVKSLSCLATKSLVEARYSPGDTCLGVQSSNSGENKQLYWCKVHQTW